MRCSVSYDPVKDIQAVDQTGFCDLAKMNATNSLPDIIGVSEESFNGIEDPNSIAGRPSDDMEAFMMNAQVAGYVPPKNEE